MSLEFEFLDQKYAGNTVEQYLVAAGVMLAIVLAIRLVRGVLARRVATLAAQTTTKLDDVIVAVIAETRLWLAVFVALYAASMILRMPRWAERMLPIAATVALFVQIGIWSASFIKHLTRRYCEAKRAQGEIGSLPIIGVASVVGRVVLWLVVFLLIIDNFGVDVTALVAGLGIGGIAIALAVQNILSDLLASVSIILDKPFEAGDFIVVDGMSGTVENIGIKTTRVQSLDGERLVFPNSNLINSRLRNYKHMRERRVVFNLGVVYQTPAALVEAIPGLIKEAVEAQANVRFDRAHFKEYGDSALIFEAVYYVTDPDYNLYMDIHQAINLAIMHRFQARDIDFAYPTRTLYLSSSLTPAGMPPGQPPEERLAAR